jgi:hypothetical protein
LEGYLLGDEAGSLLREPDFLSLFPTVIHELVAGMTRWRLRFIPHARVRMVQRGIKSDLVLKLFTRFVERCLDEGIEIAPGPYTIRQPATGITLRIDIDVIEVDRGFAHLVTVFTGKGGETEQVEHG